MSFVMPRMLLPAPFAYRIYSSEGTLASLLICFSCRIVKLFMTLFSVCFHTLSLLSCTES